MVKSCWCKDVLTFFFLLRAIEQAGMMMKVSSVTMQMYSTYVRYSFGGNMRL